jgi:hypothetical protein
MEDQFEVLALVPKTAREFVEYWSAFYEPNQDNTYDKHIKVGQELTAEDVSELMAWKAQFREKQGRGAADKIPLDELNGLRTREKVSRDDLRAFFDGPAASAAKSGIVWRIMFCHIARPLEAPIFDKNVWIAWGRIEGWLKWEMLNQKPTRPETYFQGYLDFTQRLESVLQVAEDIQELRSMDRALFEFGRFLLANDWIIRWDK